MTRKHTYTIADPKGFLAHHFGFEDWSPKHQLKITLQGSRRERRELVDDLRRIAAGQS